MADRPDLSGFTCPVGRFEPATPQAAGIAVGIDGAGDDRRYVIALRHADGTTLTGYLSDALLDRFALRLAGLVPEDGFFVDAPIGEAVH